LITDNGLYVDLLHQSASGDAKFNWSSEKPSFTRDDTTLTIGGRKGSYTVYVAYKTGQAKTDWPAGYQPDKLTATGFLAGFGWVTSVGKSAFTFGAGVGVMTGRYDYVASSTTAALESKTTIGYSLGAGYTFAFAENWSLNTDLKWQSYDYSFGSFNIQERPKQLAVGLQYTF
jgi:opacity protein-like surface antigen